MGASVVGTGVVAGGLWYFQRSLIYPAYLPDGSRTRKSEPLPTRISYPAWLLGTESSNSESGIDRGGRVPDVR